MTVLDPVIEFLLVSGKSVSLDQVTAGAERPRRPVLRVMDRLVREGYLEEIEDSKIPPGHGKCGRDRRNPVWKKVERKPLDSRPDRPKPQKRNKRDRIWKAIRMKRRFTRSELEIVCRQVTRSSIDEYTKLLVRQGYLRSVGLDGHEKVFLLIKNPGPRRPIFKNAEVKKCRKRG